MKTFTSFILILLCIASTPIFAQRDKPTASDIQKAKALREKYEDEDVVISKKSTQITFSRNRKTDEVEVEEHTITTFFAIASRADIGYSSGYDNESEIDELELYDRRDKKVFWDLNDEAYSSESIFHNDYRITYGKITLPLQGYIRKVEETKLYKDIKYFTTAYFKNPYRVLEGELRITIPKWLEMDIKAFHFEDYDIKKTETKDDDETIITYDYKDISPVKSESSTPGHSFLHPHVLFLTQSFINKSEENITLFKDTQDLYNWYLSLVKDVKVETSELSAKVNELTSGLTSDDEKIKALYYWVQDNIKYIAFEDGIAGFKPDSPQNVFNKKYGDCKGMAILLKTMLIEAGFDARLVWIGTDNIAYDYSTPSLVVDNHMITAVMLDGEPVFVDGTEKFNAFGTFASRIQGKQALIENGDSFILKNVPVATPEFNKEVYQGNFKIEDSDIVGKMNKEYTGEQVSHFLYGFTGVPKDKRVEVMSKVLTDGNSNAKIENIKGFDPSDRDQNIKLNYDLVVTNAVSSFDDNLYLELDPVRYLHNWMIPEDRENPFQFDNTRMEQKNMSLEIPSGYALKSLPPEISIDNDILYIKASYQRNAETIDYNSTIKIKKRFIPKDKFDSWNTAIEQVKNFYDEQIVLEKSN